MGTAFTAFCTVETGRTFVYFLYLVSIFIIVDHTVEFQRNNTFDDVFLVQPFQFTIDLRHQCCDLFFVHLHFFDLVDEVEKLLFTDVVSGRHFTFFEFLLDDILDQTYLTFFLYVADGNRNTSLAGTTCTATAVSIRFYFIR